MITPPDPARMAWYELSDLGNAQRLRDLSLGKLLWVEDHWRAYDGRRWSRADGDRLAQRLAHDVARHIPSEAEALAEEIDKLDRPKESTIERYKQRITDLHKFGVMSGNTNKTGGMLVQARSEMFAARDDFDSDPLALNVANGTIRFVNGAAGWETRFAPHDQHDMLSKIADVAYDPAADSAVWAEHMATVLPNERVREFFRQCIGYGLTGEGTEQAIFVLQGKGGDGKSTTMNVVRQLLGEYGSNADVQTFMIGAQRSGGEASPDLARLGGDVRMVSTGEPRPGGALDEGRIKAITGGAAITVRELHGAPFEYVPRFKVFFECNRKPRISGDDDGIWRRVVVFQFPHQFKGAAADKRVFARLLAEGPGVLAWALRGTLDWLEAGALVAPPEVQEAIDDYRRASNPFGEWFGERVDVSSPQERTLAADLYGSYKAWCEANSVGDRELMTSTAFGRAMSDKQIMKRKGGDGRVYRLGCRLRLDHEVFGGDGGAAAADAGREMPDAPAGGHGGYNPDGTVPGWDG